MGVRDPPFASRFLSKQPTIFRWRKLRNLASTLSLTQCDSPPPLPPLENPGYAPVLSVKCFGMSFLWIRSKRQSQRYLFRARNDLSRTKDNVGLLSF